MEGTHWQSRFNHLLNYGAGVSEFIQSFRIASNIKKLMYFVVINLDALMEPYQVIIKMANALLMEPFHGLCKHVEQIVLKLHFCFYLNIHQDPLLFYFNIVVVIIVYPFTVNFDLVS